MFRIKKNNIINKKHIKKFTKLNLFIKAPKNHYTIIYTLVY